MKLTLNGILAFLLAYALGTAATAQDNCATGKTIKPGVITIGTGDPAYFPWVIDDRPESGMGFEGSVAYEIADRLGFAKQQVEWVRTSFDGALEPGEKAFDLNLQQYTITKERDKNIDFSMPYYTSAAAIVVRQPVIDEGIDTEKSALAGLKWGAAEGTTAEALITKLIAPKEAIQIFTDTSAVTEAMKADQIHATLVDLPTALFLAVLMLDDGVILGQYPHEVSGDLDQFGAVMAQGSPLKPCVDAAISTMRDDGSLSLLDAKWLSSNISVPVIRN